MCLSVSTDRRPLRPGIGLAGSRGMEETTLGRATGEGEDVGDAVTCDVDNDEARDVMCDVLVYDVVCDVVVGVGVTWLWASDLGRCWCCGVGDRRATT